MIEDSTSSGHSCGLLLMCKRLTCQTFDSILLQSMIRSGSLGSPEDEDYKVDFMIHQLALNRNLYSGGHQNQGKEIGYPPNILYTLPRYWIVYIGDTNNTKVCCTSRNGMSNHCPVNHVMTTKMYWCWEQPYQQFNRLFSFLCSVSDGHVVVDQNTSLKQKNPAYTRDKQATEMTAKEIDPEFHLKSVFVTSMSLNT